MAILKLQTGNDVAALDTAMSAEWLVSGGTCEMVVREGFDRPISRTQV